MTVCPILRDVVTFVVGFAPTEAPMPEADHSRDAQATDGVPPEALEHPRGTLAIVIAFGLLFALGWVAVYVFIFLQRGAPHS